MIHRLTKRAMRTKLTKLSPIGNENPYACTPKGIIQKYKI